MSVKHVRLKLQMFYCPSVLAYRGYGRLFQRPIEILPRHSDCSLRIYKKLNYEILAQVS